MHRDTVARNTWDEQATPSRLALEHLGQGGEYLEKSPEKQKESWSEELHISCQKKHGCYYILSIMRSEERAVSNRVACLDFSVQLSHCQGEEDSRGVRLLPGIVYTLPFTLLT